MTTTDHQARLDDERRQIRQATQRLLTGTTQRSNGKLTVATLATEAALPRHRLYEHHTDLLTEFKTAAGAGPVPPSVQAAQEQLAVANKRAGDLQAENELLRQRITTLSAVITELTLEAQANNILTLPRRRIDRD
jgi:hypothetical protein